MQRKLVKYLGDLEEQGAPKTKKETVEASINVKSVQFVVFWYHGANCIGLIEQIIVFRVNQISQASVVRNRRIEFKDYRARSSSYLCHQKRVNESGNVDGENDKLSN